MWQPLASCRPPLSSSWTESATNKTTTDLLHAHEPGNDRFLSQTAPSVMAEGRSMVGGRRGGRGPGGDADNRGAVLTGHPKRRDLGPPLANVFTRVGLEYPGANRRRRPRGASARHRLRLAHHHVSLSRSTTIRVAAYPAHGHAGLRYGLRVSLAVRLRWAGAEHMAVVVWTENMVPRHRILWRRRSGDD